MKDKTIYTIMIVCGIICLIFGIIMFFDYREQDKIYAECMEEQAEEICARQDKMMAEFSAWQPYVKCMEKRSTNTSLVYVPYWNTEVGGLYIFNETEIQFCWDLT